MGFDAQDYAALFVVRKMLKFPVDLHEDTRKDGEKRMKLAIENSLKIYELLTKENKGGK